MALNKMVKKLNLESEEIDVSEVEDQTIEDVVEADVNASELQEATKELEEIQEDFEEGEATATELQEAIDHTKEVIAEAEKAAEEGKEAEVPVEEIVAAQESLKYFYTKTGFNSSNMVTVSREDIATGSLEAYKNLSANLEQLQVNLEMVQVQMLANILRVVKNITAKIGTNLAVNTQKVAALMAKLNEVKSLNPEKVKEATVEYSYLVPGQLAAENNAAAIFGIINNMTLLSKNIKAGRNNVTNGLKEPNVPGSLKSAMSEYAKQYGDKKFTAVPVGAFANKIITVVDTDKQGFIEFLKNQANMIIANAKAIKIDKYNADEDLKLDVKKAKEYLSMITKVDNAAKVAMSTMTPIWDSVFPLTSIKAAFSTSDDTTIGGRINNLGRGMYIASETAQNVYKADSEFSKFAFKYAQVVLEAAEKAE